MPYSFNWFIKKELFNGKRICYFRLIKVFFLNPNKKFLILIRLLLNSRIHKFPFLHGYIYRKLVKEFGSYISPNVKIGVGVVFPHPNGIILGGNTLIGNNCTIYQQVTFGGKNIGDAQQGNYPKLGNNVIVFAGAKLVGDISIGNDSIIGANGVVIKDVQEKTIVGGIPARLLKNINS